MSAKETSEQECVEICDCFTIRCLHVTVERMAAYADVPMDFADATLVLVSPPPETSDSARVRLSHPCKAAHSSPAAISPPPKPVFDFRAHFCHSALWKRTLSASDSGPTPGGPKAISYQFQSICYQAVSTALRDERGWNICSRRSPTTSENSCSKASCRIFRDNNMKTLAKSSATRKASAALSVFRKRSRRPRKYRTTANGQHDGLKETFEKLRRWRRTSRKRYAKSPDPART